MGMSGREKCETLALLVGGVVTHNAAHNAVFYKWNALEMYKIRTLPDFLMDKVPLDDLDAINMYNDVRLTCFVFILASAVYSLVEWACRRDSHCAFSALRNFIEVYIIASLLRCTTFFATVLPGTASYCLDPSLGGTYSPERAPKNLDEVLTRFDVAHSCGDLLFSGHVVLTTCAFLTTLQLSRSDLLRTMNRVVLPCFCICTVLSRKHYSIDVLLALYVTYLLWQKVALAQRLQPANEKKTKADKILEAAHQLA